MYENVPVFQLSFTFTYIFLYEISDAYRFCDIFSKPDFELIKFSMLFFYYYFILCYEKNDGSLKSTDSVEKKKLCVYHSRHGAH